LAITNGLKRAELLLISALPPLRSPLHQNPLNSHGERVLGNLKASSHAFSVTALSITGNKMNDKQSIISNQKFEGPFEQHEFTIELNGRVRKYTYKATLGRSPVRPRASRDKKGNGIKFNGDFENDPDLLALEAGWDESLEALNRPHRPLKRADVPLDLPPGL
jgi:hypothetical protein